MTDALQGVTTMLYDAAGNLQTTIDPLNRHTTYQYDQANRLVKTTDALGVLQEIHYNQGMVDWVQPATGGRIEYTEDYANHVSHVLMPDGGDWKTGYLCKWQPTSVQESRLLSSAASLFSSSLVESAVFALAA